MYSEVARESSNVAGALGYGLWIPESDEFH